MKQITRVLDLIFFVLLILALYFKNITFTPIFEFYLLFYILYNVVFAYKIYKPETEFNNHIFLSITIGISTSFNLLYIFGKILSPENNLYIFSSSIVLLFALLSCIILIHFFRKKLKTSFHIKHNYYALVKIILLIIFSATIWFANPYKIGELFYGNDIYSFRLIDYKINYNRIQNLINENQLDTALKFTNIEIEKLEQSTDFTSSRFQELLLAKAYIYFSENKVSKADSLNNLVLDIYSGYDSSSIDEIFDYDYRWCYYQANFYYGLIQMGKGYYEKADSIFQITLNYYGKRNGASEIHFYQADIAYNLDNLEKADSLLELSLKYLPLSQLSSKRHLHTISRLAYLKNHFNDIQATDNLLNCALYLFDKKVGQYNVRELTVNEKFERLRKIANEMN